jgi:hypothetical protein
MYHTARGAVKTRSKNNGKRSYAKMVGRAAGQGDGGADPENLFGGGTGIEIRKTPEAVSCGRL